LPAPAHIDAAQSDLAFAESQLREALTSPSLEDSKPAEALLSWLQLSSSLTAELTHRFGAPPGLRLLGEGLELGQVWEHRALSAGPPLYARHIALTVNDTPVVLARTVTTQGPGMAALTKLRTRPLAELLFEDDAWQRGDTPQYLNLQSGAPGRGYCWFNASLQTGLVVQEFFLPSLCAMLAPRPNNLEHCDSDSIDDRLHRGHRT
jgi:chorismate-pyruvate lyase